MFPWINLVINNLWIWKKLPAQEKAGLWLWFYWWVGFCFVFFLQGGGECFKSVQQSYNYKADTPWQTNHSTMPFHNAVKQSLLLNYLEKWTKSDMWKVCVSTVPTTGRQRLLPEGHQLFIERTHRTQVQYVLARCWYI